MEDEENTVKTCEAIDPTLLLEMEGVPNNEVMQDAVLEEHAVASL